LNYIFLNVENNFKTKRNVFLNILSESSKSIAVSSSELSFLFFENFPQNLQNLEKKNTTTRSYFLPQILSKLLKVIEIIFIVIPSKYSVYVHQKATM
jgi:hypothetical protein